MSNFVNSLGRPTPNAVSYGGSGVSSTTPYAVSCAGTSGSNPIQFLASLGSSGQALMSNGASSLPSFSSLPTIAGSIVQIVGGTIPEADLYPDGLTPTYVNSLVEQTITPSSSSSSILIFGSFFIEMNPKNDTGNQSDLGVQLWRGAGSIVDFGNGQWVQSNTTGSTGIIDYFCYSTFFYYDSPSTTSATTYAFYVNDQNATSGEFPVSLAQTAFMYLAEIAN